MSTRYRIIALLAMLLVAATVTVACSGSDEPTPVPAPTREVVEPETEDVPQYDSAWERVQAEGLVIGTSADYPPFESYNDDFEIDGFDIALAQAIADQIGVEAEVKDFAFDGLYDALSLGQMDVAIAAISATPEREEYVDFSFIYLVSEDAFLAADDAEIEEITKVEELADFTIGTQRGSVFQDWLEEELVETGLMAETDIFLYGDVHEGLIDVAEGRVDLIVMDLQPAQIAAEMDPIGGETDDEAKGFKIVAQGLNRQNYALAVYKGENDLRSKINQAMLVLKDDGTITDLAEEYLDLGPGEMLPVPDPGPDPLPTTMPPPPRPGCIDGMAWVSDLTHDDQNMTNPPQMAPGEAFQKGWRVRNIGTCTWDSTYTLQFAYGNRPGARMNGQTAYVQGSIAPGQTYDFYVDMVAPLKSGVYQGVWQMHNGQNVPFGERVYVGIQVVPGPTPTPAVTATPSAEVTFYADSTSIKEGDCTTIHWEVENIKSVYFYEEGQDWSKHGVTGKGSQKVCPSSTTTYVLRVVSTDDTVNEYKIKIHVEQNHDAPDINTFTVVPAGQIPVDQCVTLTWDVGGSVAQVDLSRNDDVVWGDAPFRGSIQDCPPGAGDYTYMLEATGPGGTSRSSQAIHVVPNAPTPTPVPTGEPEPVIDAFSVLPQQLYIGGCVTIAWSTSGGTSRTDILKNGAVVQHDAGLSGQLSDCLPQEGTYDYRLEAYNRADTMISSDASVTVGDSQPTEAPEPTEAPTEAPAPTDEPAPTEAPEPTAETVKITSFVATPPQIDTATGCTTLTWTIEGAALASLQLFRNTVPLEQDPVSPYQDCPDQSLAGTTIAYTLVADAEQGGSDTGELAVEFPAPLQY